MTIFTLSDAYQFNETLKIREMIGRWIAKSQNMDIFQKETQSTINAEGEKVIAGWLQNTHNEVKRLIQDMYYAIAEKDDNTLSFQDSIIKSNIKKAIEYFFLIELETHKSKNLSASWNGENVVKEGDQSITTEKDFLCIKNKTIKNYRLQAMRHLSNYLKEEFQYA